jgi:hypothetical protein
MGKFIEIDFAAENLLLYTKIAKSKEKSAGNARKNGEY